MKRTLRFWIWHRGGWVKLALRPGETRTVSVFSTDTEGWSRETDTFEHDGAQVRRTFVSDGRDCDGRLTRGGVCVCHFSRLAAHLPYRGDPFQFNATRDIPGVPDWETLSESQRDENAELAGY